MKTLQQIYDFCKLNQTWRCYYDAPSDLELKNRQTRKYWYGEIRLGQCRVGSFLYSQGRRQLERFLGKDIWTS